MSLVRRLKQSVISLSEVTSLMNAPLIADQITEHFQVHMDPDQVLKYSKRPKSGHSNFGPLIICPIPKQSRFQTTSEIGMKSSRFRMFFSV